MEQVESLDGDARSATRGETPQNELNPAKSGEQGAADLLTGHMGGTTGVNAGREPEEVELRQKAVAENRKEQEEVNNGEGKEQH